MWNEGDPRHELRGHEEAMARSSGAEVVVIDDRVIEAASRAQPGVTNINVTKSSRLHIGPKFVSVTQNVDNTEVVKGRILGLELVSPQNSKRLRCSIAVFVCWAFVVASGLTFFIFQYALASQNRRLDLVENTSDDEQFEQNDGDLVRLLVTTTHEPSSGVVTAVAERHSHPVTRLLRYGRILGLELVSLQNYKRLWYSIAVACWVLVFGLTFFIFQYALSKQDRRLDLDLPLPRYLWDIAKSTTRAERLSCAAALIVLTVCILLIVYFTVIAKKTAEAVADVAPHEWFITRDMWLAPPFQDDDDKTDPFNPLRLVIIAHTVSSECTVFANCAAELRNLQSYFTRAYNYDLPYNFLIGNDGRVYVGRGWNVVGAHTLGYNRCSLCIAFIGDYREGSPSYSKVSEVQLQRAQMLLDLGVTLNYLHEHYHVLGAKDLKPSQSPGANLYKAIRQWSHYDHNNFYKGKTCEQIRDSYQNQTSAVSLTATLAPDTLPPVLRDNTSSPYP